MYTVLSHSTNTPMTVMTESTQICYRILLAQNGCCECL